jgi:hypothetical protein
VQNSGGATTEAKERWSMAVTFKKGVFRLIVIIGAAIAAVVAVNLLIAYL